MRLKDKILWEANNSHWEWKKILKLREEVRKKIKIWVSNGISVHLWFDNCHKDNPLIEKYGEQRIYDLGLGRYAKVSSIIKESRWYWLSTNLLELMEIKENLGYRSLGNEDLA